MRNIIPSPEWQAFEAQEAQAGRPYLELLTVNPVKGPPTRVGWFLLGLWLLVTFVVLAGTPARCSTYYVKRPDDPVSLMPFVVFTWYFLNLVAAWFAAKTAVGMLKLKRKFVISTYARQCNTLRSGGRTTSWDWAIRHGSSDRRWIDSPVVVHSSTGTFDASVGEELACRARQVVPPGSMVSGLVIFGYGFQPESVALVMAGILAGLTLPLEAWLHRPLCL